MRKKTVNPGTTKTKETQNTPCVEAELLREERRECRVVVVTSGKGGVGKSTIAANLGARLAAMGKKVVVVDMDIGLRNMDILLGLESRVVFNIIDVAEGTCRLDQALVRARFDKNLLLLPASQTKNKDDLPGEASLAIFDELKREADFIIVDCPAGIENGFRRSVEVADEAIVVVNPEISSIRDSDRVIAILDSFEKNIPQRLVVNRVNPALTKQGDQLSIKNILEILSIPLLGVVRESESCANRGEVFPVESPEGLVFEAMAKRVLGEDVPMEDPYEAASSTDKGFFGVLAKFLTSVFRSGKQKTGR